MQPSLLLLDEVMTGLAPREAQLRDPWVIEAYLGRGVARRRRTG